MKFFLFSFVIISLVFLPIANVFAADNNETMEAAKSETQKFMEEDAAIIEPGVLPNSFWYWADIFTEEIRYIFTVGKEKKADYLILLAEERLAEMKALTEVGITTHTEQLLTKYETHIRKAEDLYRKLRTEGVEQLKEKQEELEYEILETEYDLDKELRQVPKKYEEKRDSFVGSVMAGFRKILNHLSWKKEEIDDQRATFEE